ncbi:MAG TPA: hypothetical protein VFF76_06820 [Holophagaceae bacterium]|jgi:hypothetical protein|nr:hypothetical protein [Holophagaceae bacterium]
MPTDPMDLDAIRDTLAAWLKGRRQVVEEELAATIQLSLERLEPDEALLARLADAIPEPGASSAEGEAAIGAALDGMGGATSQAECLQRMLDGMALLAPRSAVFIVKQGILNLYAWRGFHSESPKSGTPVVPPPELLDIVMGRGEGLETPGPGYQALMASLSPIRAPALRVLPLRLKRRTVAVVLADSGTHSGLPHPQLVRALVQCGAAALGNLGTAAPEDRVSVTQQVPEVPAPAPAPPAIPAPMPPIPPPPIPMSAPPLPVSPSATTGPITMNALRPPPLPPLPTPITAHAGPMEITNPGLAVGLDPKVRSAAERLARVLTGDIELYFPAKVAQARTTGNLYGLLRDELERSRQTFLDRFGAELEKDHGIFHETVVSLLCDGDATKLGTTPWK